MKLYPLTYSQKSIYYTEKLYQGTSINNVVGTVKIQTNVDFKLLSEAINIFIKNNDGIRIKVVEQNGQLLQYVEDFADFNFEMVDFSGRDRKEFFAWEEKEALIPFDFFDNYLFSFTLFKLNETEGGFLYKSNHIISDAWSMGLVGSNVVDIYSKLLEKVDVENNAISYEKHILDEQEYILSEKFIKDETFWNEQFYDEPDVTTLKLTKNDNVSTRANRKTFVFPNKLYNCIKEFPSKYNVSPFALYMAALSIYINRITDKTNIALGTMMLNRSGKKDKNTLGMFVNTVGLPIKLNEDEKFLEFVKRLTLDLMKVMRHQSYPFEKVQKYVKDRHGINKGFCDIVVSYQNTKFMKNDFGIEYSTRWHFCGHQNNGITIHINDRDSDGNLIINYDYLVDVFAEKEIEFIHDHITRILWHSVDNSENTVKNVEMISEAEKNKLLNEFNDTYMDFDNTKTIDEIFNNNLESFKDKIAVVEGKNQITYDELNIRANALAYLLQQNGVTKEHIIGIVLPRSIDLVVAILAVLKSGGAYLPIDIEYPKDRKKYMLEDSHSTILITNKQNKLSNYDGKVICIDDININNTNVNIEKRNEPSSLAYIIYTSGTTGNPKGVMIEHRNVLSLAKWFGEKYNLSQNRNIGQITNISFDVSVEEIIVTLLNGATIFVIPQEIVLDRYKFINTLNKYKINIMQFVPATLKELLADSEKVESLNVVICGGEELPAELKDKIISRGYNLFNHYGPTEITVDAISGQCNDGIVTLGKPIANTKCYILNKNFNLLPIGIEGELYIGGAGIARGYLNHPEITEQKFIKNPFNEAETLYRTGDIARWLPKGDIYFIGRKDHQVKINGHRIEIYDIKLRIKEYPEIDDAIVMSEYDEELDRKYLIAYVITKSDISVQALRTFLLKQLPAYMIPSYFVFTDKIPLLESGKLDVNKLKSLRRTEEHESIYIAPTNETEKLLCDVWCEVLNLKKIGIADNVFTLGADSLSVISILSRVFQYNWGIKAQDIYANPTVKELAEFINSNKGNKTTQRNLMKIDEVNQRLKLDKNIENDNILLTGSTGFVGVHILKELLKTTNGKIYCLVRANDKTTASKRLEEIYGYYFADDKLNRVEVICGDITKDNLGLNVDEYNKLSNAIQHIIHSAAIVKPFGNYNEFYNINVKGTENVLKLCEKKNIVFNYISTISVSGNYKVTEEERIKKFTENDYDIGQDVESNIYVKSKFEAEKLVLEARNKGIKTNIFRLGTVTNRYSDGKMQINIDENAFILRIYSLMKLQCVSNTLLEQEVDILPVDYVAKAVVALLGYYNSCFHVLNNNFYLKDIIDKINVLGHKVEKISEKEFENRVMLAQNKSQVLAGIINDFTAKGELKYVSNIIAMDDYTKNILNELNIVFPKIDEKYISFIVESTEKVKEG